MSADSDKLTLEDFQRFKRDALVEYLRDRGQQISKLDRASLEALCYGCETLGISKVPSNEEKKRMKADQYRQLLCTPSGLISDPYELKEWECEKDGMKHWPPIMELEIGTFLLSVYDAKFRDLGKRMLSDYKEGKGYSYTEKWLGEIFYHPISSNCTYCFLRAETTPSMKLSSIPHKIWVMVEKVSGSIQSAYCTCFAG